MQSLPKRGKTNLKKICGPSLRRSKSPACATRCWMRGCSARDFQTAQDWSWRPCRFGKDRARRGALHALKPAYQLAVITNDIYTREDAEFLTRRGVLSPERIVGVETGGCPHTAIREDASVNLEASSALQRRFPDLDILFIERRRQSRCHVQSGIGRRHAFYVIDVAEERQNSAQGGGPAL